MPNCRTHPQWPAQCRQIVTAALSGVLCAGFVFPVNMVAAESHATPLAKTAKTYPRKHVPAAHLTPEQKALHALNRFSFGPRPGELAEVEATGVDAWFERQLHPESLPDDALALRLAQYPAMQLPQDQLVARFPTPGMLRRYSRGGLEAPADPVEHAIYAEGAYRYQEKAEAKQVAGQVVLGKEAVPAGSPAPITRVKAGAAVVPSATPEREAHETEASSRDALFAMPAGIRLERLAAMTPEQIDSFQASLKGPDQARLVAGLSPGQAEQVAALRSPERLIDAEVTGTRLLRDVYSQRQLQAVMTDFWLNHFSIYLRKNQNEPYLLPAYERGAILPHALGRFEDLLVATAESPAMLVYLDNWESLGPNSKAAGRATNANRPGQPGKAAAKALKGINENYARELMELHTLGVKGGYTQADVIEVARCFTGWTIDRPDDGGTFQFNANRHEPGSKVVLGHVIPEGGMNEGLAVLHLLATSPATAHFVSQKMAERFVSDAPPPALVNRMAATFLKTDGDIAAVLTTLFHAPEFWSPDAYRAKVKTPLEYVVSALRSTNSEVVNPAPLVQSMDRLGMPLYGMQTPNGYSWQAASWVSSNALLTRMNFALVLSGNRLGGTKLSWPELLGSDVQATSVPTEGTEDRLELALLGQPAAPQTRAAALVAASTPGIQVQAEQSFRGTPALSRQGNAPATSAGTMMQIKTGRRPTVGTAPETPLATTAGLLLGSPDFQRR